MSDSKPTTQKVLESAMNNSSTMSPAFMYLCDKANNEYKALEDECMTMRDFCHRVEDAAEKRKDLTLYGVDYIALPLDADGMPIHVGDVMEGVDKYDSLKKVMGKVITVSFESDGTTEVAIRAWNSDGKSWRRAYLDPNASVYRHHHEPTVEDVLREFVTEFNRDDTELCDDEIIERFAKRLQLADGDTE